MCRPGGFVSYNAGFLLVKRKIKRSGVGAFYPVHAETGRAFVALDGFVVVVVSEGDRCALLHGWDLMDLDA